MSVSWSITSGLRISNIELPVALKDRITEVWDRMNTKNADPHEIGEANSFADESGETAMRIDAWFRENYGVNAVDLNPEGGLDFIAGIKGSLISVPFLPKIMFAPKYCVTFMRAHELGHAVDELRGIDPTGQAWKAFQCLVMGLHGARFMSNAVPAAKAAISIAILAEEARASYYAAKCLWSIRDKNAPVGTFMLACAWMTYLHGFFGRG
jgi:hypothetical protein